MFQEKPADYVPPDTQRDMAFSSTSDCSNLPVPSNTKPPYLMRNHTGQLLGLLSTSAIGFSESSYCCLFGWIFNL